MKGTDLGKALFTRYKIYKVITTLNKALGEFLGIFVILE